VEGSLDEFGLTIGQAGVELPSEWGIDGVRVDPANPLFIGWDGTLRGSVIATDVPFVRGIDGETRIDFDVTYQGADSITLNAQATPFPATTITMTGAIGISGGFDVDVEVSAPAATATARINQHNIDAGISFEPGGDLDGFMDWLGEALADGLNPVELYHQGFCDISNLADEDEIPSFANAAGFRFYTDDLTPAGADCTDPAATIAMNGGTVVTYPWLTIDNADATFRADGSVVVHSGAVDLTGSLGKDWGLPVIDVTEDITLHADGQVDGFLAADSVPFVKDALDWLNTPGQFNVDLGTTTTVTADVVVTEGVTIALGGMVNTDGTFGLAVDTTTPHGVTQAAITRDHVEADINYQPGSSLAGLTKWVLGQLDDTVNHVDVVDLSFCDVWEMAAGGAITPFATDSGWRVFPKAGAFNATGSKCTTGNARVDMTGGRIALSAWLGIGNVTAQFTSDGNITVTDADVSIDGNWQVDTARIDKELVLGPNGIESGSIDLGTVPFLSDGIADGSGHVVFSDGVARLDVDATTTADGKALDIDGTVASDGSIDVTITVQTAAGPVTGSLGFDGEGALYVTVGTTTKTIQNFIVDNLYDVVWPVPDNGLDFCEIWARASIGDVTPFGSNAGWNFFPADGQFTATGGVCAAGDATIRMTGGTIAVFSWLGITDVDATFHTDGTVSIDGGTATLPDDWELTGIRVDADGPLVLDGNGVAHGTLATDGNLPFLGDTVPEDLKLGGTNIVLGESNGTQAIAIDAELTVAGSESDTGISISGDVALDGSFDLEATVTLVIDEADFVIEGRISRSDAQSGVVVDVSGEFADPIWFDDNESNGITNLGFELSTSEKLKLHGTLVLGIGSMFSTSIPLSIEWQRMEDNEWRFRHNVDVIIAANPLGLGEPVVVDGEVEYLWKFWGGKSSFKLLSLEGDHTNEYWNPTPSIDVVDFDLTVETDAEGKTTGYAAAATVDWRGYNEDGSLTEPYRFSANGSYDLEQDELALRVDTDDKANAGRMIPLMPNIFIGRVHLDMTWNPDDGFRDAVEIQAFLGIGGLLSATVTFKGSIMSDSGKMLVVAELGEKSDAWEGAVREIGVGFRNPTFVYSPVNNDARLSETIDSRMPDLYNFNGLAFAGFIDWGQWGSGGPNPSSKFLAKVTLPSISAGTGYNAMGFDLRIDLPQSGPAMLYGSESDINKAATAAWVGGAGLRIAKNPDGLSVGMQLEAHVQYPTDLTEEGYDRMTIIGGISYGLGQGTDLFDENMGGLAKFGTALFRNGDVYIYLKMHQRHENAFGVEGLRINEFELSYGSVSRGVDCQAGPGQSDGDLHADCFDADGSKVKDRYPLADRNPQKPKSPNKAPGTTVGLYADVTLPTQWREAVGMHEDVSTVAAFAIGANWCVAIEVGTPGSNIPAIQPLQGDAKDKLTLYYGRFVYAPRGCTIGDHAYYGYNFDLEGDLLDVPIQLAWELKITNIEALGAYGPMVWSSMLVDIGEFKISDAVKIDRTVVASSFVHFMGLRSTEFELQGGLNIGENELNVKLKFVNNLGFSKDQALKMLTPDFNVKTAMSEALAATGLFLEIEAHMHLDDDVTEYQSLMTLGLFAIQDLDLYMSMNVSLGAAPQLIGSLKLNVWLLQQPVRIEAGIDFSDWKLNNLFGRMAIEPRLPGLEKSGGSAMFSYERGQGFEAQIGDWCSFVTHEDYDDVLACEGTQEGPPSEETEVPASPETPGETVEETGPRDPGSMSGGELEEWLGEDDIDDADWDWLEPTIEMRPFQLVVGDWELGRVAGVITADYLAIEAAIQLSPIGKASRIEGRVVYGTDEEALEGFTVRNRQGEYVQASPGDVMFSAENIGYPVADWLSLTGDLHLGWLSDNGYGESEFYVDIAAQLAVLGADVEVSGSFSSLGVFQLRGELAGLTVMGYGLDSVALEVNGDGLDVSAKLSAAIDIGIAGIDFEGELGVENGVPGARLDGTAFIDFGAGFGADANVRFSTFPSDFGLRGDISMDVGNGTVTADGALTVTGSGDYWVSGDATLNVPWGLAKADAGFTFTNCTDATCEATTTPSFGLTTTIAVGGFNFHLLADVRSNGSFWVEAASYASTNGSGGWGPFSYGWDLSYTISLELGWKNPDHNPIDNLGDFDLAFHFAGQASAWGKVDLWLTSLRGSVSAGVCGSFDLDGNLDFGLEFKVVGYGVKFGGCW
ncbi:MAG: hypothetical protein ACR2N9_08120, partial [Acidimicrobiia bacterium]